MIGLPPKPKFTKDEITNAALTVAREKGIGAVSAREVAVVLGTSTRPIFTYYHTMDELKKEVRLFAENIFRQYVEKGLARECCNYNGGHCVLLDDGAECVCVQSISFSLLCRWFKIAVLPLNKPLEAALLYRDGKRLCATCKEPFIPASNRGRYCPDCAKKEHRRREATRQRKRYAFLRI